MSKPIWDAAGANQALADTGYSTTLGSPQARIVTHSIPGVDGVAIGLLGIGGRMITGRGFFEGAVNATPSVAMANLNTAIKVIQALVSAAIKSFTDTDGIVYPYCVLLSWQPVGLAVPHTEDGTTVARVPVAWTILQQEA